MVQWNGVEVGISRSYTVCSLAESAIEPRVADFLALASCSRCTEAFGLEIIASNLFGVRDGSRICQWSDEENETEDVGSHVDEMKQ
jgi:hypothetical protein